MFAADGNVMTEMRKRTKRDGGWGGGRKQTEI